MPKDDNQQPTPPTTNSSDDQFPVFVEETLPPMPQEEKDETEIPVEKNDKPQEEKQETLTTTIDLDPPNTQPSGSAAPIDDSIMPPTVTSKTKRKFGSGKIIATILGLFLLVGGTGAGVFLVNQNQDIREKAALCVPNEDGICEDTESTTSGGNEEESTSGGNEEESTSGGNEEESTSGGNEEGVDCSQIKCTNTSCTVGSLYPDCYVNHWTCESNAYDPGGCNDKLEERAVRTASYSKNCGVEQIDIYCPACGREGNNTNPVKGQDYIEIWHPTSCSTTENPPITPITASCLDIRVYTESWTLISQSNLPKLKAGDVVNFCVNGTSTGGNFDKAKITVNGNTLGETINKRPNSIDFCSKYTIPSGTRTFNVASQIHHISLGWK